MNKQEAIERIKNIDTLNINDMVAGQQVDMVIKNQVLDIISQIDEPVEKEKLYTVEIPNPHSYIGNHSRLARNYKGKVVLEVQDWLNTLESYELTESEIKQDFEWAWQFAEEVE